MWALFNGTQFRVNGSDLAGYPQVLTVEDVGLVTTPAAAPLGPVGPVRGVG